MSKIEIPDFSSMTDDELHGWEFTVYDKLPGDDDLVDIIGLDNTQAYYAERGRRNDLAYEKDLREKISALSELLTLVQQRLSSNSSGQYYYKMRFTGDGRQP